MPPVPPKAPAGPRADRLLERLRGLRARARACLVVDGASTIAVAAVALGLATFGLDRLFRLPRGTRAGLLFASVALLAWVVAKKLVARLRAPLPLDELARVVERVHPEFDWRLVSAVQIVERGPPADASRELSELIVRDAEARAEKVSFGVVIDGSATAGRAVRGVAVAAAGVLLLAGFPDVARTWFRRVVLLSATEEWPKDTRLRVIGFEQKKEKRIPLGTDLVLDVVAEGVVPHRVYVDFSLPESRLDGTQALNALEGGRFRTTFERVSEDMLLSVRGGDDAVTGLVVKVVKRSVLQGIEVTATPPEYTRLKVPPFRAEAGEVELPEGTRIRIASALASQEPPKRIVKAWAEVRLAGSKPEAPALRLGAKVDGTAAGFAIEHLLERTASFTLDLEDQDGLGLERPVRLTLRARPDTAPKVALALRGVGQMVSPEVTLPLELRASDDYGLAGGEVQLKATGGGLAAPREDTYAVPELSGLRREASLKMQWDLAPLDLKPGTVVTVLAHARDDDPKGAKTTPSASFALHVVSSEDLLNEMLRRQHEARKDLERACDDEEKLGQGLAGEDQKTLERGGRTQRAIQRTVGEVAQSIAQVVEEMKWNKLLDERARNRLQDLVATPLEQLKEGQVALAREAIDAAAAAADAQRGPKMKEAGAACDAAVAEMRAILERMKKIEDVTAIVARLRTILKQQRDVLEETRKQREGK